MSFSHGVSEAVIRIRLHASDELVEFPAIAFGRLETPSNRPEYRPETHRRPRTRHSDVERDRGMLIHPCEDDGVGRYLDPGPGVSKSAEDAADPGLLVAAWGRCP